VSYGDLIDSFFAIIELKATLIGPAILLPVEILGLEECNDFEYGLGVDKKGTQHGLFGIEVVRGELDV
jgi:hypothetical protein